MSNGKQIIELKKKYITYFQDVPIQKYASMHIARDEDTIIRWKNEDNEFADAVKRAKADWVRKKMLSVKAEFALERLEKSLFSKETAEETVKMPQPLIYFPEELPYDIVNKKGPIVPVSSFAAPSQGN